MLSKVRLLTTLVLLSLIFTLSGCDNKKKDDPNTLKVGIIAGPEQDVALAAQDVAKKRFGLNVQLINFNDYVLPNEALSRGDIDVNAFQHAPFLAQQIKERGYKLANIGNTFIYPIAGYSKKIHSLSELPDGAGIAIPNDPTNLGRSLLLLQKVGLIKLKPNVGLLPTQLDIIENNKHLKIHELEAPQLPRALDDPKITIAIINTTYSGTIGLSPVRDGLFMEDKDSPYVNIIVSREDNKNDKKVQEFVKAYQSQEVVDTAERVFKGGAVKGW